MAQEFKRRMYNGIPDPEDNLVRILTEDAGRFRKTAGVIYRCEKAGCLLGFSYPVLLLSQSEKPTYFGELDVDGNLLAHAPTTPPDENGFIHPAIPKPFGPFVVMQPLELGTIQPGHWFFAFRAIDPEFFSVSPDGQDIGFSPAGSVMGHPSTWPLDESNDARDGDFSVVGKRDVWAITDMHKWTVDERRAPAFTLNNPPGLMNCRHYETTVTVAEVEADMERYHHRHPVMIPRD